MYLIIYRYANHITNINLKLLKIKIKNMSIINISIEQNYNQIFVKKKDLVLFEKELNNFQKKWKSIIELFDGRFLYIKNDSKQNTYFFFQDEDEQIDISSNNYTKKSGSSFYFETNFVRFLSKAEDNEDAFEYSLGLKFKTGLDPFDKDFYSDLFKLTNKYGEISFIATITSTDVSGYWDSTYDLTNDGINLDSSYCD